MKKLNLKKGNHSKAFSILFSVLALVLSHMMCLMVGYNYGKLSVGIDAGFSAPASTAFFIGIPYVIGIVACVILSIMFWKKIKENNQNNQNYNV